MFQIYALREIGSIEVRYVGQTSASCAARLGWLYSGAIRGYGEHNMREWMRGCGFAVETIVLDTAKTREEAREKERIAIRSFWAAGHRLLNHQHLPKGALPEPEQIPARRPFRPYQVAA